jgi:hypothetical protein
MAYPVVPLVPTSGLNITSAYPANAVPKNATSGDVAASIAAATLPAASGKTTYITGFSVVGTGATSATVVDVTVSDGTWTLTYPLNVPATSAAIQLQPLVVNFGPALPASASNTTIVVSCPSLGAGNAHVCTNAQGYQL